MSGSQSEEGRQRMAKMAFGLMGGNKQNASSSSGPTPPTSAAAKATIPRSIPPPPSQAAIMPTQWAQPSVSATTASPAMPQAPARRPSAPAPTQENAGPSLRGNEAQLQAAREMLASSNKAGHKSRDGSRQRKLSVEPNQARQSPLRASSYGRASAAAAIPTYAPAVASPRPRPSTLNAPTNVNGVAGTAFLPAGGMSQWQAMRGPTAENTSGATKQAATASSAATITRHAKTSAAAISQKPLQPRPTPEASQSPEAAISSQENTSANVSSNVKPETVTAAPTGGSHAKSESWQLKDFTNTLKDRASTVVPPHARHKPTAEADTTSSSNGVSSVSSQAKAESFAQAPQSLAPTQPKTLGSSIHAPKAGLTEARGSDASNQPSKVSKAVPITAPKPDDNGGGKDSLDLKADLAAASEQIASLEAAKLDLEKQVLTMTQADERRKFRGTDDTRAPFGLQVKIANADEVRVQAAPALKVGELIRRIRVKAGLPNTLSPRLALDGQQLGHAMTLDEAGITERSNVVFTNGGGF